MADPAMMEPGSDWPSVSVKDEPLDFNVSASSLENDLDLHNTETSDVATACIGELHFLNQNKPNLTQESESGIPEFCVAKEEEEEDKVNVGDNAADVMEERFCKSPHDFEIDVGARFLPPLEEHYSSDSSVDVERLPTNTTKFGGISTFGEKVLLWGASPPRTAHPLFPPVPGAETDSSEGSQSDEEEITGNNPIKKYNVVKLGSKERSRKRSVKKLPDVTVTRLGQTKVKLSFRKPNEKRVQVLNKSKGEKVNENSKNGAKHLTSAVDRTKGKHQKSGKRSKSRCLNNPPDGSITQKGRKAKLSQKCGEGQFQEVPRNPMSDEDQSVHVGPPISAELICPLCQEVFSYAYSLCQHLAQHTKDGDHPTPDEALQITKVSPTADHSSRKPKTSNKQKKYLSKERVKRSCKKRGSKLTAMQDPSRSRRFTVSDKIPLARSSKHVVTSKVPDSVTTKVPTTATRAVGTMKVTTEERGSLGKSTADSYPTIIKALQSSPTSYQPLPQPLGLSPTSSAPIDLTSSPFASSQPVVLRVPQIKRRAIISAPGVRARRRRAIQMVPVNSNSPIFERGGENVVDPVGHSSVSPPDEDLWRLASCEEILNMQTTVGMIHTNRSDTRAEATHGLGSLSPSEGPDSQGNFFGSDPTPPDAPGPPGDKETTLLVPGSEDKQLPIRVTIKRQYMVISPDSQLEDGSRSGKKKKQHDSTGNPNELFRHQEPGASSFLTLSEVDTRDVPTSGDTLPLLSLTREDFTGENSGCAGQKTARAHIRYIYETGTQSNGSAPDPAVSDPQTLHVDRDTPLSVGDSLSLLADWKIENRSANLKSTLPEEEEEEEEEEILYDIKTEVPSSPDSCHMEWQDHSEEEVTDEEFFGKERRSGDHLQGILKNMKVVLTDVCKTPLFQSLSTDGKAGVSLIQNQTPTRKKMKVGTSQGSSLGKVYGVQQQEAHPEKPGSVHSPSPDLIASLAKMRDARSKQSREVSPGKQNSTDNGEEQVANGKLPLGSKYQRPSQDRVSPATQSSAVPGEEQETSSVQESSLPSSDPGGARHLGTEANTGRNGCPVIITSPRRQKTARKSTGGLRWIKPVMTETVSPETEPGHALPCHEGTFQHTKSQEGLTRPSVVTDTSAQHPKTRKRILSSSKTKNQSLLHKRKGHKKETLSKKMKTSEKELSLKKGLSSGKQKGSVVKEMVKGPKRKTRKKVGDGRKKRAESGAEEDSDEVGPEGDEDSGIGTECEGSPRKDEADGQTEVHSSKQLLQMASGELMSVKDLWEHVSTHLSSRSRLEPATCPMCTKSFAFPSALKRHVLMHTGERAHKCPKCPKAFARVPHLEAHLRTHTGEKPYRCAKCPAAFAQHSNLKVHMRTHTGARPFGCPECGARFRRQDAYSQHLLTHHSGVKPFTCAECGAAFACPRYLKDHLRTHTTSRPFRCPLCPAAFVCNKYLLLHTRAIHTNYRPFRCPSCPARFTQSGKLREHSRVHTGERPYHCSTCKAAFTRSGHLRRHLRVHTGERPYSCEMCKARFSQYTHLKRHKDKIHKDS